MRIFRGLENIHSVIDKHQAEWLREQGEELERPERLSVEERIRRSFAETSGTGRFSADRFMGGHVNDKAEVKSQSESQNESQSESSIEVVNVIPQKDENHSWLYNEVLKAINAAIGDSKNTKVIAVFVPVVQNGKEFENLPVDETITIDTAPEEPGIEPLNSEQEHEEIEIAPSPFMKEPEKEPAEELLTEEPELPHSMHESQQESQEESQEEPEHEELPVINEEPEEHREDLPEEISEETEFELPAMGEEFDLFPEGQSEPDAELAEAFQTMEEKLDDNLHEHEQEVYQPEHEETFDEPAAELPVIDESLDESGELSYELNEPEDVMTISKGEPLEYEEIELPEPLDDDDAVFDDSVFEDNLNDNDETEDESDEETIIIEDKENEAKHDILKKHE